MILLCILMITQIFMSHIKHHFVFNLTIVWKQSVSIGQCVCEQLWALHLKCGPYILTSVFPTLATQVQLGLTSICIWQLGGYLSLTLQLWWSGGILSVSSILAKLWVRHTLNMESTTIHEKQKKLTKWNAASHKKELNI